MEKGRVKIASTGEVWEWCRCDGDNETVWEPVLLLERIGPSRRYGVEQPGLFDWLALDLLTGEVNTVYNVPRLGWEKVE